jgi:hypothetical protein
MMADSDGPGNVPGWQARYRAYRPARREVTAIVADRRVARAVCEGSWDHCAAWR